MSNKKIPRSPVERGIFCSLFPVSCVCPVLAGIPAILLSSFSPSFSPPFLFVYFSVHFSGIVCRHLLYVRSAGLYPACSSSFFSGYHLDCPAPHPLIHSPPPPFSLPLWGGSGWGYSSVRHFPFCIRQSWRIGNAALSLSPSMGESEGASLSTIFSLFLHFFPSPLAYSIFLLYLCTRLRYYSTILVC